jgi:hypothetical protein
MKYISSWNEKPKIILKDFNNISLTDLLNNHDSISFIIRSWDRSARLDRSEGGIPLTYKLRYPYTGYA